jgi:uncharacterized protein YhdP
MSEIALAKINSLPSAARQAGFESPSEQLITLTYDQLQDLIRGAIQPLQDKVSQLRATVDRQDEKIVALEARIGLQEDNGLIQLRLINDLREVTKKEPQPMQKDRGEILRALLAANGGKMIAKDARQKMRLDKATFSRLLDTLKGDISIKPLHTDKRKMVLMLKIS